MATNNSRADAPTSESQRRKTNLQPRILVVEDDHDIRRLNTEVLTYTGYRVDAAKDGADAWDALQKNNYDLVVTDNNMPRLTGAELIQKLLVAGLTLPVIMATGALPEDGFNPFASLQPALTLIKPYTVDELLRAVEQVLRAASESPEGIGLLSNPQVQPLGGSFQGRKPL